MMTKDKEWLKEKVNEYMRNNIYMSASAPYVIGLIDQLDEPGRLSKEWIDRRSITADSIGHFSSSNELYVSSNKLQNLIVPKQEEIDKEKQEAYVKGFEAGEKQTVEFYEEHESKDFNKKVNQLIKAIENPKRIKLRDVIERMDVLSEKNRNDWIERVNKRYEVEEEQKYYVMNNDNRMMLVRMMDGKTITEADPFKLEDMYEVEKKSHRLTEQEIKDYDERYWAFAVKVEELEE